MVTTINQLSTMLYQCKSNSHNIHYSQQLFLLREYQHLSQNLMVHIYYIIKISYCAWECVGDPTLLQGWSRDGWYKPSIEYVSADSSLLDGALWTCRTILYDNI